MTQDRAAAVLTVPAFMVTEEMINERDWSRGQRPFFSVDQVAKFFFAMSASWLRLKLKPDKDHPQTWFVNPDGTRMEFRRNKPGQADSSRVFTLADIEPMAWSLFRLEGIKAEKLGLVLHVVEAVALLYELIGPSPAEDAR
jgi:hypothetical protein